MEIFEPSVNPMGSKSGEEFVIPEGMLSANPVRLVMRNYLSTHLLAAAGLMERHVDTIEAAHDPSGKSRFDLEQRGYVLAGIFCSVGFLEAVVNELFQDAFDRHNPDGGALAALNVTTAQLMAEYWRAIDKGEKGRILDKYQAFLRFADQPPMDEGARPFQDAKLAIRLRNTISHYKPEDLSADVAAGLELSLKGKFPNNVLLTGSGNPWWPDHCLGLGCVRWVLESVVAVADHVLDAAGIEHTNYRVHRATGWLGQVPGAPVASGV